MTSCSMTTLTFFLLFNFFGQRQCDVQLEVLQNNVSVQVYKNVLSNLSLEERNSLSPQLERELIFEESENEDVQSFAWYQSTKQQYPNALYLKSAVLRANDYILNSVQLKLTAGENITVVMSLVKNKRAKELWVEVEHNEDYLADCIGMMEVPQYAVKSARMERRLKRGGAVRTTEYYSVKSNEYMNDTITGDAVFYFRNNATYQCAVTINAYVMLTNTDLPSNQRIQLNNLYNKCCPANGCSGYSKAKAQGPEKIVPNFCSLPGHHCSTDNSMTVLDMSDMHLSCSLTAAELNEFTDLKKIDFSANPGVTISFVELMKIIDNNKDLKILQMSQTQITGFECEALDKLVHDGGSHVVDMDFNRTQIPDDMHGCEQFREAFKKIQVIGLNKSLVDFHPIPTSANLTAEQLKAIDLYNHDELRCPSNVSMFEDVPTSALVGLTCRNYYISTPLNSVIYYRNRPTDKYVYYSYFNSHAGTLSLNNSLTLNVRHSHPSYSTMRSFEVQEQNFQEIYVNFTVTHGACDIEVITPRMSKISLVGWQKKSSVLQKDGIFVRPDFQEHKKTADIPRGFYQIMFELGKADTKCVVEVTVSAIEKISFATSTPSAQLAVALRDSCCPKNVSSGCKRLNQNYPQILCLLQGMHCNQHGQLTIFDTTSFNFNCLLPFKQMKMVKSLEQIYIDEGSTISGHWNQFADLIASLPNLKVFKMTGQKIDGQIRCDGRFNETFAKIVDVDLSNNQITGELNHCIFTSTLKRIDVSNNKLSGSIPDLSEKVSGVKSLILKGNNLSGNLSCLETSFPKLVELDAGENALTGSLPTTLPSTLRTINVADNKLTGGLPMEWDKKSGRSLRFVDVSGNPFDEEIFVLTDWAITLISYQRMVTEGLQGRWMCPDYITTYTWHRFMTQGRKYFNTRCLDTDLDAPQVVSLMSFAVKKTAAVDETYMGDLGKWEVEENWQRSLVVEGDVKKALYTFDVDENARTLLVRAQHMSGQCDIAVQEPFVSRFFVADKVTSDHHSHDELIIIRENARNGLRKGTYKLYVQNSLFLPCRLIVSIQATSAVPELTHKSEKQAIVNIYKKCCDEGSVRFFYYYTRNQNCYQWNKQVRFTDKIEGTNFCSMTGQNCENGRLTILDFSSMKFNCSFEDIQDDLAEFRQLQKINLNKNTKLAPTYSQFLKLTSKLHNLKIVWFEDVQMTGNLVCPNKSPDFSVRTSVFRIADLRLSQNKLNGTIPDCIFTFSDDYLKNIDLSQNQLSGNLPAFAKNIESVDLSRNQLEGDQPILENVLKNADNLLVLDLGSNIIEGPLPVSLPIQLLRLNINRNRLRGPLSKFWDMDQRHEFDMSGNPMLEDAEIPQWMAKIILQNEDDIKTEMSGELDCPTFNNLTWFKELQQEQWLNEDFMCEFGKTEVSLKDYLVEKYSNLTINSTLSVKNNTVDQRTNLFVSPPMVADFIPLFNQQSPEEDNATVGNQNVSNNNVIVSSTAENPGFPEDNLSFNAPDGENSIQPQVATFSIVPSIEFKDQNDFTQFTNDTYTQSGEHIDLKSYLENEKHGSGEKPPQSGLQSYFAHEQNTVDLQDLSSSQDVQISEVVLHDKKQLSWMMIGLIVVATVLVFLVGAVVVTMRKRFQKGKKVQYRDFDEDKVTGTQNRRDACQTKLTNRERPHSMQMSTLMI